MHLHAVTHLAGANYRPNSTPKKAPGRVPRASIYLPYDSRCPACLIPLHRMPFRGTCSEAKLSHIGVQFAHAEEFSEHSGNNNSHRTHYSQNYERVEGGLPTDACVQRFGQFV